METKEGNVIPLIDEAKELLRDPANRQKKASNTCSDCGLPHARSHKGLTAENAPTHTLAREQNYLGSLAILKEAVSSPILNEAVKERFAQEIARLDAALQTAQLEHSRYEKPVPESITTPQVVSACGKCGSGMRRGNTIHCACGVRVIESMEDDLVACARRLNIAYTYDDEGKPNLVKLARDLRRVLEKSRIE